MPWTDTPKKVEQSEEKMEHVGACVRRFIGRRYYPSSDEGFGVMCDCLSDIVWDKEEGHRWDKPDFIRQNNIPLIGNDLEWLTKTAYARLRHCPSPREFRAIYCAQGLMPADGVMINEEIED